MLFIWKNRGFLVPVFFILTLLVCIIVNSLILGKIGIEIGINILFGIGIIVSAILTFIFREDYYKNAKGEKDKLDIEHTFFFIDMKSWSYIELVFGVGIIAYEIYYTLIV